MKTFINLLPVAYRRRTLIRRRLTLWCVAWSLALAVAAFFALAGYQQYSEAHNLMLAYERSYAPLKYLKDETAKTQQQFTALVAQESVLDQLRDNRPALSALGLVSRATRACQGRVRVEQFTLQRESQASGSATAPGTLTLKGVGLDNLAVAKFVVALRATGAFEQVDLKSSVGNQAEGDQQRTYMVECRF